MGAALKAAPFCFVCIRLLAFSCPFRFEPDAVFGIAHCFRGIDCFVLMHLSGVGATAVKNALFLSGEAADGCRPYPGCRIQLSLVRLRSGQFACIGTAGAGHGADCFGRMTFWESRQSLTNFFVKNHRKLLYIL